MNTTTIELTHGYFRVHMPERERRVFHKSQHKKRNSFGQGFRDFIPISLQQFIRHVVKFYSRKPVRERKCYKTAGAVDRHMADSGFLHLFVFFILFFEQTFRKIKGPEHTHCAAGEVAVAMMGEFYNINSCRFVHGAKILGKLITQFADITGFMQGCFQVQGFFKRDFAGFPFFVEPFV